MMPEQRWLATLTSLARDMIERVRANAAHLGLPRRECRGSTASACAAMLTVTPLPVPSAIVAEFDLWEWESLLLGETESRTPEVGAGGLVSPRACIARHDIRGGDSRWLGAMDGAAVAVPDCTAADERLRCGDTTCPLFGVIGGVAVTEDLYRQRQRQARSSGLSWSSWYRCCWVSSSVPV
ncbi:MAG: hypothetical protein R3E50_15250 [Halioglobus sp.]